MRRIETRAVTGRLGGVRVELHPELADALQNERRQELAALEREFDIEIEIIAASGLHRAEERVEWRERTKGEERVPIPAVSAADLGQVMKGKKKPRAASLEADDADQQGGEEETKTVSSKEKPRRRRRGGRKHKKAKASEKKSDTQDAAAEKSKESAKETAEADAENGEVKPATKKRRRRPRRSKKKTVASAAAEEAPPASDPFAY